MTIPDQNQPTPPPFNPAPSEDQSNPANWVTEQEPEPPKETKAEAPKAPAKKSTTK